MFEIGDRVLYSSHGACTIAGIESMRFGKTKGKYYVLQPAQQPEAGEQPKKPRRRPPYRRRKPNTPAE